MKGEMLEMVIINFDLHTINFKMFADANVVR